VRSILSVTLAAAALVAAAALTSSAPADAGIPSLSALSRYVSFPDRTLTRARAAGQLPDTWDSRPTTTTGESVKIHLSQEVFLAPDTAVAQHWADFFASLVHGSELARLDAYLLSPSQISAICGRGALACYGNNRILTPAEDPAFDLSAESVAAHEYGHHVAAHRLNPPWDAIDYGTKRWASYMNVCAKTERGMWFPGEEDEDRYFFNPGEGFAEAYRVLNEQQLQLQEAPWDIVSEQFMPNSTALAVLRQDVTSPWTKNTTLIRQGSVSKSVRTRAFSIQTPVDGRMSVRLISSAKAKFRLDILSPTSTNLGHATGKNASAGATVCGQRAVRLRVKDVSGAGAFKLTISRP
jgi:hypothetical protein